MFEPGELVPAFGVLQAVSEGNVQAGYTWAGYDQGTIPAIPLFAAVPFGLLEGGAVLKLDRSIKYLNVDAAIHAGSRAKLSAKRFRVAVEAAVTDGWYKYVGINGKVIGLNRFGESAPAGQLFKEFGFTADNVLKAIDEVTA